MSNGPIEIYQPRVISDQGVWDIDAQQFKIYGLLADGQALSADMLSEARRFLEHEVLDRVASMGESNGLGFVIVHPGELGLTISANWWVQGSVLCQHNYRKLYGAAQPMDTITRPVVACVWELALINAEQQAWRDTMMRPMPVRAAYLEARPDFDAA